ncbi:MAG: AMP-binding protein, partial [Ilumatobacter sp.]|nr:AMP-binding protein [Ilumatobacter sp.]
MNLANVIEGHSDDRRALIDGETVVTFGELRDRVSALRSQLASMGISRGDSVALAAGNEVHFATGALAVLGLGAIVMPVNPQSPPAELRLRIDMVQPRLLLVGDDGQGLLGIDDELGVEALDMTTLAAVPVTDPDPG